MPCFGRFNGPVTIRLMPGGERNSAGTWKVRMPLPKWLEGSAPSPWSGSIRMASLSTLPSQRAGDLPAMHVGNVERQAAIAEAFGQRIHPVAGRRGRPDVGRGARGWIGDQLHG